MIYLSTKWWRVASLAKLFGSFPSPLRGLSLLNKATCYSLSNLVGKQDFRLQPFVTAHIILIRLPDWLTRTKYRETFLGWLPLAIRTNCEMLL